MVILSLRLHHPECLFYWSSSAQQSFDQLKQLFSPDASDSGMGDILSQQVKGKLHPCAFFSRCLTQAEQNYDMGDRELLAIKLALEERQHCLVGSDHLVLIWTDHKNLAYLQAAKRLNARQARWALFSQNSASLLPTGPDHGTQSRTCCPTSSRYIRRRWRRRKPFCLPHANGPIHWPI